MRFLTQRIPWVIPTPSGSAGSPRRSKGASPGLAPLGMVHTTYRIFSRSALRKASPGVAQPSALCSQHAILMINNVTNYVQGPGEANSHSVMPPCGTDCPARNLRRSCCNFGLWTRIAARGSACLTSELWQLHADTTRN